MIHLLALVLLFASYVLVLITVYYRFRNGTWDGPADGFGALANLTGCAAFGLLHWWPLMASAAFFGFLFAWDWWRKGRKRKRNTLGMIGYKARAALAALVRKAREAAKPRPVLRPVPGGARCS